MGTPVEINPLQLGAGGYQIGRSVRLRSSATAYFNRTMTTPTNANKWTWSGWVKRGSLGGNQNFFAAGQANTSADFGAISFAGDAIYIPYDVNGTVSWYLLTTPVYRDPSAWYHIVVYYDSTQATAANRVLIYVNGVQVTAFSSATYPTQNTSMYINTARGHAIGNTWLGATVGQYFDGYLAEVNFIDGQALTPSSFGTTDSNGIWQPKAYTGTYGTNGFYLKFTDNSAATAAAIGKDYSGNGNNWTPNNISVTAGVTYDSMIDSPTVGYAASNYAVLNPLNPSTTGLSNGNLTNTNAAASYLNALSTFGVSSGFNKLYAEFTITSATSLSSAIEVGVVNAIVTGRLATSSGSFTGVNLLATGNASSALYGNGITLATGLTAASAGEVFQVAIDPSTLKCWIGRGNVWYDSAGGTTGNPSSGTNQTATLSGSVFYIGCSSYANTVNANFGQRPFTYTPPSGFAALNTYNLPAATINNGATVMAASLYTGNGTSQSIVNSDNNAAAVSFKPDLVWSKNRSTAASNNLQNSVIGATKELYSNLTNAEATDSTTMTSFNSNGFSVGSALWWNANTNSFVAWQWQAGQGTTSSNTNGSITSTVSVNQSAGFSVATFTAPASGGFTVGHGLGIVPAMIIVKDRSAVVSWVVGHKALTNQSTYYLQLNSTGAASSNATVWNNTSPTSTVVSFGVGGAMNASDNCVMYCWSEVAGYSKFGSYTGNGSTDGPFIYCGFRPRWLMIKRTDAIENWYLYDTSRNTYNQITTGLFPNLNNAESSINGYVDVLSNGFKLRANSTENNASGGTYIYAAFAENPFNISRAR